MFSHHASVCPRTLRFLAAAVLLAVLLLPAFSPAEAPAEPAGTRDCQVESLQMHLSLPSDFILADEQERLAADPDGQALFLAYNENRSFTIRIGLVYPTAHMKNLNLFEEKELLEMADSFAELYGASSDGAGTVEWINDICYIRTAALREDASPAVCETAYLTILSNHFFAIAFTAPDDASAREEIARVMDSVRYSEEMADPANSFASDGGSY